MSITKAVIPAAGLGTRVLPATKNMPKEMYPIVDKPTIQFIVEEAVAAGITDILIITNRGKGLMEDHFDASPELESLLEKSGKTEFLETVRNISNLANISFIRQKEMKGLGHAVIKAKSFVGNDLLPLCTVTALLQARFLQSNSSLIITVNTVKEL